jgi:hypothetical protein
MSTLKDEVLGVSNILDEARIGKARREQLDRFLARIAGYRIAGVVTAAEDIANPEVREDDPHYWRYHDRETARNLIPLRALKVDAANIAGDIDPNDYRGTPTGWYPRVTVELKAGDHELTADLTVDLTSDQARSLAIQLLTAAEVVSR